MLKKNKSIALVMILSLLGITVSCAPKNTQAKLDKPKKANTSWERKLCKSKLDIISSYGDDQAFHPKVLNFKKPWNGYRYWMAYTPYPGADQRKENPHVCVSNDKVHWKPFEGKNRAVALDPLIPFQDPDRQYNSDTHLVYRKDINTLECYWRQVDNRTRIDKILKRTTTDGIHWSDAKEVLVSDANVDGILSPAILYENGIYKMWTVNYKKKFPVLYRESKDGYHWNKPVKIQLRYPSKKLRSWHLDVIHTRKGYEMLVVAFQKGHKHREMNLYYTSSKNERDFKKCITILKPSEKKKAWDNRGIYRSSFFVENGTYYIYYSGIGYPKGPKSSQGVGLTYGTSVKNIHGYDV